MAIEKGQGPASSATYQVTFLPRGIIGAVVCMVLLLGIGCKPRSVPPTVPQPPPERSTVPSDPRPPPRYTVSSDPPGATVKIVDRWYVTEELERRTGDEKPIGVTPIGVTPCEWVLQANEPNYFAHLLVEKESYLAGAAPISWVMPRPVHVVLVRDMVPEVLNEAKGYSVEYKKRLLEVLGKFDKALSSPRITASSVVAEGKTEIEKLTLDFPDLKDSAAHKLLQILATKAQLLTSLPRSEPRLVRFMEALLVTQVRYMIDGVKAAIGV